MLYYSNSTVLGLKLEALINKIGPLESYVNAVSQ